MVHNNLRITFEIIVINTFGYEKNPDYNFSMPFHAFLLQISPSILPQIARIVLSYDEKMAVQKSEEQELDFSLTYKKSSSVSEITCFTNHKLCG